MNILGHPYVAFKATGRLNKYLVIGSHLPDLVPFVPNSVFSFEEIHEGGKRFLQFLQKKYPQKTDLALGMMTHSVKFGADKFNQEIEEWLLDNEEFKRKLSREIVACSGVSLKVARKCRMHNYLWSGIDIYLLKTKLKFVNELARIHGKIERKEIANLLAEGFKKEPKKVKWMLDYFLEPVRPELLVSLKGLVKIWGGALAGLPEKDVVNEEKTLQLFEKIYIKFQDQWPLILKKVIRNVKKNLSPFL